METTNFPLPNDLILRFQGKSSMPAVEGLVGIMTRVLDEHDKAYPDQRRMTVTIPPRQEPKHFTTQRGFDLPIGLELFAEYRGKKLKAKVTAGGIEYGGRTYEVSPSAFQAKKDCGASDSTASTNGWKFWMFMKDGRAEFIDALRPPVRSAA